MHDLRAVEGRACVAAVQIAVASVLAQLSARWVLARAGSARIALRLDALKSE
jgi:hypothetical protein